MLFSGKENIFKCLVAFQKMLWKIFSGVWLYGWKSYFLQIFHTAIQPTAANSGNQKPQPPKHHHHNKNQNHTEIKITQRERLVGRRSVGRRRDHAEARSKVRSAQCDRRTGARKIDWCMRSARTGARGPLLPLALSLGPEFIWNENRNGNSFPWSKAYFFRSTEIDFRKIEFSENQF